MWYKLEGKIPVECSIEEASLEMEGKGNSNQVAKTVDDDDQRMVSTIFLHLDHNMEREGPPLLFETMVFSPNSDWIEDDCARCATWDEALEQHQEMCDRWGIYQRKRFAKKTYGAD